MKSHQELVDRLRQNGLRITPQRVAILEAITDKDGHITADEIFARINPLFPYVDISTVYRTLDYLTENGLLNVINLGTGRAEYELVSRPPHHHLVCRHCKQVISIDGELVQPLRDALLHQYGFAADIRHFAIFGLCRACREAEDRE
ncbi:MAG: transcriptional repressor [Anaerolineae bacterium]|nr:transcriptional repressor [Anaerolineae bacterium]